MTERITITDLTIERDTATWGGPIAKATVTAGPLAGRSYWLRSTEGLDSPTARELERGGGIHLDSSDPERSTHGWMGAYKTWDMDEAITFLVETVNEQAARAQVSEATWELRSALTQALESFDRSLEQGNGRDDWEQGWLRVQDTVGALAMKIEEARQ